MCEPELVWEQAHYHLMLTVGYVEQQTKRYTLIRLDVSHDKSLDCGKYLPPLTLFPAVDFYCSQRSCCPFEIIRNNLLCVINQRKKQIVLNEHPF